MFLYGQKSFNIHWEFDWKTNKQAHKHVKLRSIHFRSFYCAKMIIHRFYFYQRFDPFIALFLRGK